jgi:hypothetical protein
MASEYEILFKGRTLAIGFVSSHPADAKQIVASVLPIDINEDVIKERPYKEGFFNLFVEDWHLRNFGKT